MENSILHNKLTTVICNCNFHQFHYGRIKYETLQNTESCHLFTLKRWKSSWTLLRQVTSTLRRSPAARDQASPCTSHDGAFFFNSRQTARPRSPEAPVTMMLTDITAVKYAFTQQWFTSSNSNNHRRKLFTNFTKAILISPWAYCFYI